MIGKRPRIALLLLPLAIGLVALLVRGPLPQAAAYHHFADGRSWMGVPNAGNVLSNAFFLVPGLLGLALVAPRGSGAAFLDRRERAAWIVFFAGVSLTAFGSAYYHLAPDNARLSWDRLPMTLAFTSLLAAVLGERLSVSLGARLLWPLVLVGAGSVLLWRLTEEAGRGDVRLYGIVEVYSLVAIPLSILLFPARYTETRFYWWMAAAYAFAVVFEALDRQILAWTGVVSGHTLKHVAAASACALLVRMLKTRSPVPSPSGRGQG